MLAQGVAICLLHTERSGRLKKKVGDGLDWDADNGVAAVRQQATSVGILNNHKYTARVQI